mmetsp:Transcript_12942/g.30864  ORF Transcript_12942/g.30864 Transcript_12942/m.30864 type:complete len:101 (+) Transcript_12942:1824-2126(+)
MRLHSHQTYRPKVHDPHTAAQSPCGQPFSPQRSCLPRPFLCALICSPICDSTHPSIHPFIQNTNRQTRRDETEARHINIAAYVAASAYAHASGDQQEMDV